ncbi:hypothetical protein ACFYQA_07850 [Streptomyces sp. NPDC005774]|uniref:hypothetical protein n=1 Tax=Streptomyces sp. NPDC005774 TaxID=3364728 RepID=UPI00369938FA
MTSAITQEQPLQPSNGTSQDDEPEEASVREEEFLHRDESRLQTGSLLTTHTMARRLPHSSCTRCSSLCSSWHAYRRQPPTSGPRA